MTGFVSIPRVAGFRNPQEYFRSSYIYIYIYGTFPVASIQARQTGGFGVPAAEEDLKCPAPGIRGKNGGG